MFYNFFTLIFYMACFHLSFSQPISKAYYKKTSSVSYGNTLNSGQVKASISSNTVNKAIDSMQFLLVFNDNITEYKEVLKLETNSANKYVMVFSGYQDPYYFNFKSKEVLRVKGKYLIAQSLFGLNWQLSSESMIINGLTCYKVTTGLELEGRRGQFNLPITAWDTNEINILAGPDGFSGLPGLIIQIEQQNVVTILSKMDFTKYIKPIKFPKNKKRITEKEFADFTKDLIENREKYYSNNQIIF